MDAFITFGDDRTHAEQTCSLGGPIARRSGTVFFAGKDDERNTGLAVPHGSVVNGHFFVAGEIKCPAALGARSELVTKANICKGTSHHDFVISAARAVGVEVMRLNAVGDEVFAGGGINRNGTGGGNMGRWDVIRGEGGQPAAGGG